MDTAYLDAALAQLRTDRYPVRDEDVVRLSPYMRRHLNVNPALLVPAARPHRCPPREPDEAREDDEDPCAALLPAPSYRHLASLS